MPQSVILLASIFSVITFVAADSPVPAAAIATKSRYDAAVADAHKKQSAVIMDASTDSSKKFNKLQLRARQDRDLDAVLLLQESKSPSIDERLFLVYAVEDLYRDTYSAQKTNFLQQVMELGGFERSSPMSSTNSGCT